MQQCRDALGSDLVANAIHLRIVHEVIFIEPRLTQLDKKLLQPCLNAESWITIIFCKHVFSDWIVVTSQW